MPYWRLYYHVIWATRDRAPLIGGDVEQLIARSIQTTCTDQGVILHGVGMMPEHVHLVVSISPSVAIATVGGRLKGASAHAVNHADGQKDDVRFAWQAEYGVLSFSERSLAEVMKYVTNQQSHHTRNEL